MSSEAEPSVADRAGSLAAALAAIGIHVRVDVTGTLAVLVPLDDAPVDWSAARRDVVRFAADLGFSHVAVEPATDRSARRCGSSSR